MLFINGEKIFKPAFEVPENAEISVDRAEDYSSLGGIKLKNALEKFGISSNDKICIDIGASNGGFTDVMLRGGAKKVYAVDVGECALPDELIADGRVEVRDRLNARYLTFEDIGLKADLITVDVSFISLKLILPALIQFMTADSQTPAVGILKEDYTYGTDAGNVIPEGSLVFMGTYKGNPAYNMVILYDAEGNIIGSREGDAEAGTEASVEAEQVILADVPQHGNLGEVSEGIWVYYLEPGKWSEEDVRGLTVRGELYRVDNALTLEGERVVSDTLPLTIPETLPSVTITALR